MISTSAGVMNYRLLYELYADVMESVISRYRGIMLLSGVRGSSLELTRRWSCKYVNYPCWNCSKPHNQGKPFLDYSTFGNLYWIIGIMLLIVFRQAVVQHKVMEIDFM